MTEPRTKAARPETLEEARAWETVKNKYLAFGLCHACASQAAWGHQIGFAQTTRPPCAGCAPLVETLPRERSNGWRTPEVGKAGVRSPSTWAAVAPAAVPVEATMRGREAPGVPGRVGPAHAPTGDYGGAA